MNEIWAFAAVAVAIVCVVRATQDWKQGKRKWACAMVAVAVVLLSSPLKVTHKVSIDLPANWFECTYERAEQVARKSVEKNTDIGVYTVGKFQEGERYFVFRFKPPADSTGFSPVVQVYKRTCKAKVTDWI